MFPPSFRPWLWKALALTLPLWLAGCWRPSMPDWFASKPPAPPLREVLPGRWTGEVKGHKYLVTFGRHQEVSFVVDVPPEYRARLGTDQLWVGGNYHVENDHSFNCQWTDGRWAEIIARIGGMPLHQVGVKSYEENEFVDGGDVHWRCIGHAAAGHGSEAADIADQAPTINDAPRAKGPAAGPNVATKTLYDQQQKLTVLYNHLGERRRKLNPKDKNALAAFNRAAEEYSREVAAFNSASNSGNAPPAATPAVPPPGSPAAGAR